MNRLPNITFGNRIIRYNSHNLKPKIIIVIILIFLSTLTFSQGILIKGKLVDYETNKSILYPKISDLSDYHNVTSDEDGNFEIDVKGTEGNLLFEYLGYYPIKFINIPIGDKQIDFGEFKMVRNYFLDNIVVGGGKSIEITKEQKKKVKRLKKDVIRRYRIKLFGKEYKPYFDGQYNEKLVFDFSKNENN